MKTDFLRRHASSSLIQAQIPIIEKIIRDETWFEGERRGHYVSETDTVVIRRVCRIIRRDASTIIEQALFNCGNSCERKC